MYVETYQWLEDNPEKPDGWDTERNSILEAHLVHARVLINFFFPQSKRDDDVLVADYIHEFNSMNNVNVDFLRTQAKDIGGKLVHLTLKPKPYLMSEKEWQILEIVKNLVPIINSFLKNVPESKFEEDKLTESKEILSDLTSRLTSRPSRFSLSPST